MFRQSCYSISPIFHWIGLSTQQADNFSTLIDFPDAIFQTYCNFIRTCELRVLQQIHIHVSYVNSIITLQTLGHSDLILFIYQLKNQVKHYSKYELKYKLNFSPWKTNWIFQRALFFPLGRQTEFFPLEDILNFSLGRQTEFFPWKKT